MEVYKYGIKLVREERREYRTTPFITKPELVVKVFNDMLSMNDQPDEVFALMTLDSAGKATGVFEVNRGEINQCAVSISGLFKRTLLMNCNRIIVAHNHPSGNLNPSSSDDRLTEGIVKAGKLLGVKVLDHVIIGSNDYFSYKAKTSILD